MKPILSSASIRLALAGAVAASTLVLAVSRSDAQAIAGHNSNAPVDYAADRIELMDKQHRVVLSGAVDVKQADLRLRAADGDPVLHRPELRAGAGV